VSEVISVREEDSVRGTDDGSWTTKIRAREAKDCRPAFTGKHTWKHADATSGNSFNKTPGNTVAQYS